MELTNVIAAVPEGEHFDATAVNEGIWVSQTHMAAIESKLAENASKVSGLEEQLGTANADHATAVDALNGQLATAQETINANAQTIADLQAEIATLKASAAGDFTAAGAGGNDNLHQQSTVEVSETTKEAIRIHQMRTGGK